MPFFSDFLYPELHGLPVAERASRLRLARQIPFDAIELFGMAAGLVVVTALTRYAAEGLDAMGRVVVALANFAIALPLLALCLGPFYVRRVRRGLRSGEQKNNQTQPLDSR